MDVSSINTNNNTKRGRIDAIAAASLPTPLPRVNVASSPWSSLSRSMLLRLPLPLSSLILGLVDLETIDLLWYVSRHHRLMAISYLQSTTSLTITAMISSSTSITDMDHRALAKHDRILTLLSRPMKLRTFRVIYTVSDAYIIAVSHIIQRNCRTLTHVELWPDLVVADMSPLYWCLSACCKLRRVSFFQRALIPAAPLHLLAMQSPDIEMMALSIRHPSIPGGLSSSDAMTALSVSGWRLRELRLYGDCLDVVNCMAHLPLISTLTSLSLIQYDSERIKDAVTRSIANVLSYAMSLVSFEFLGGQKDTGDNIADKSLLQWCLPVTCTHVSLRSPWLPARITGASLQSVKITDCSGHVDDLVSMVHNMSHVSSIEYSPIGSHQAAIDMDTDMKLLGSLSSPVKWTSLNTTIPLHHLIIIPLMTSLTHLTLSTPMLTCDARILANIMYLLSSSLTHLDTTRCGLQLDDHPNGYGILSRPLASTIEMKHLRVLRVSSISSDLCRRLIVPSLRTFVIGMNAAIADVDITGILSQPSFIDDIDISCPFTYHWMNTPPRSSLTSLTSLRLYCASNMSELWIKSIISLLLSSSSSLRKLELCTLYNAQILTHNDIIIPLPSSLTSLTIGEVPMDTTTMDAIITHVHPLHQLRSLDITFDFIDDRRDELPSAWRWSVSYLNLPIITVMLLSTIMNYDLNCSLHRLSLLYFCK